MKCDTYGSYENRFSPGKRFYVYQENVVVANAKLFGWILFCGKPTFSLFLNFLLVSNNAL